jgi:hypothetical protein
MPVTWYQIAGLVLRIDSDVSFPTPLSDLEDFRIAEAAPDLCYYFCTVTDDALTLPPLNREEAEELRRARIVPGGNYHSPLLQAPAVRHRLARCLGRPEQVSVELGAWVVTILDLFRRELVSYLNPQRKALLARTGPGPGMLAPFLPAFSAAMLHAAGVLRGEKVAVFVAPDGGGKTTVACSSGGATILSDDQVILRKVGGTFAVHGSPWGRHTDPSHSAPAAGLFFLEQSDYFQLVPIRPREAIESLWSDQENHRLFLPRQVRTQALDLLLELCNQVPTYRMRFAKDHVDWAAIDAAMAS